jgi:ATP-dependent RNA helicase RhlE
MATFEELKLHPDILKGIRHIGFATPTPIQEQSIPAVMTGQDVIASAQTGSGKTAAFVLPILHRLLSVPRAQHGIRALVLSPTRELALQSTDHLKKLSSFVPLRGEAIFGGVPMSPQISALRQGLDIVSATPGRLLDHTYEGRIDYGQIEVFVLDEADRMMDMGFMPDVQRIISFLPPKRQNLIFSATIADEIMDLAKQICHEPIVIRVGGTAAKPPSTITQKLYPVSRDQKAELLLRVLKDGSHDWSVIIFTRTKLGADKLWKTLERAGIRTSLIHGDRSQSQRLHAIDYFRQGRTQCLVATDVAARGLDIQDVSHVVNFDVPEAPEDYIHRIGRTARAGESGDALTLVSPDEEELVDAIEKAVKQTIERVKLENFQYRDPSTSSGRGGHRPHGHGHGPRPYGRHGRDHEPRHRNPRRGGPSAGSGRGPR